ncbi:hypothetical protein AB5J72_06705 [Streptomyces sp. CG1]|uniref:hypothetical protein n=1 Tax=Streptomyces sp. CG1 TaxID=1287523 RepID=UPI0034E1DD34
MSPLSRVPGDEDGQPAPSREHLHGHLQTPYNLAKFRRLGYTDDDLSGCGSNRLVDDLVFWGDPDMGPAEGLG